MAFIVKNKWKYFELVRNIRLKGKHKRELLFYMGSTLSIPNKIVMKFKITNENITRLKSKYKSLEIIKKDSS